jgi:hypothetical protein
MNKIPKHIIDIYIHALKFKEPLTKMMYNGVETMYTLRKGKASRLVEYYIISEKKNDSNR